LPFPAAEGAWERFPFLAAELDRLGDPALVELAEDPRMRPLFRGGDVALLDRAPDRRRYPDPEGCYALDLGRDNLIRCVRRRADALCVTTMERFEPLPGDYVSLADRNILEVVKAKVVWIGRNLEPSLFAPRSPEQTG
jgi:hypothetical protein